jgi:hypothetical protein
VPGSSRRLRDTLGRWTLFPQHWRWFYSAVEDRLYRKERWLWRAFPVHRVRTSARLGSAKHRWSNELLRIPPPDLIHASVTVYPEWVVRVSTMDILPRPTAAASPRTVQDIRTRRHTSFSWAITELSVEDDGSIIAQALRDGTAIAVSDGSYKHGQGTSAFIIEGNTGAGRLVGVNVIPGESESQTAYRAELGGVAGILELLYCVCTAHSVTEGSVEVGLDGDQARKAAFGSWPLDPGSPDYDLLQHIRGMILASPLTFTSRWIESHQDDHSALVTLDRWGKLNVECDGLAKSFWNTNSLANTWMANLAFGHEKWSLWIEGKKLSQIDKQKLYSFTFAERTRTYWHRKHSLTPELITSINWEACGDAMDRLPFGKKRWLLKHATGFCGVGRRELLRGNQDHDDCPRCGDSENARHVVECKGTGTDSTFDLAVTKLETSMTELDTAPWLLAAIVKRIRQWRRHGDRALPRFTGYDQWGTQHAVRDQDAIGWYQFLIGRIARKWSDAQQRYIDSLNKKNSGRRWAASLIQKALDVAWDMWEQRNDIKHNTLHPRRAAEVMAIKVRLQMLYRQGRTAFLPQDGLLFAKTEETLLKGTPGEMLQWISSVVLASRRAAAAATDLELSMKSERNLMQRWLNR